MNVDPNNIIRIELVQDNAVLWKFDLNWTLPEHLAQARWSLDGYLFRYIQHFKESNPVLKAVAVAGRELEIVSAEHKKLSDSIIVLINKVRNLEETKTKLATEVLNLIQERQNQLPVSKEEIYRQVEEEFTKHHQNAFVELSKIKSKLPRWIKWLYSI